MLPDHRPTGLNERRWAGALRGIVEEVPDSEAVARDAHLRPIERRMRRLVESGVDPTEVAWRFRRSQRSVSQILALGSRPHREASASTNPQVLRPLERRILTWREAGASYAEIGARFSPQSPVRSASGGHGPGKAGPSGERRSVGRDLWSSLSRTGGCYARSGWEVPPRAPSLPESPCGTEAGGPPAVR